MSARNFKDRVSTWIEEAKPADPVTPPPPLYELVMQHGNPLGLLGRLMKGHPHSMPVGVSADGQMIYTKPETTLVGVGPARSMGGKSASITTPALIEHNGPAVVMSLRTDALLTTVALRSLRGRVFMSNPEGLPVPAGVEEMRWSLLVGAEDLDFALITCRTFIKSAAVISSSVDHADEANHFTEQGGSILGVVCHYAAVTGKDFRWVHQVVATGNLTTYDEILDEMSYWDDRRPFQVLSGILSMPGDRERGSILTTLNVGMAAYQTEAALASTDNPNFIPSQLVQGNAEEENPWLWWENAETPGTGTGDTLYLIAGDKPIAAAINVAIVTQLIEARHRLYRNDEQAGNPEAHPDVLFGLDEMANMPLPQAPELFAAPGRGCLFTGQLQDFTQLSKWGRAGESMLTQMQQLLIFRGQRDDRTLKLIESLSATVPTMRVLGAPSHDSNGLMSATASAERLPAIPIHRIYSGINDFPTTVLYLGADGLPPQWIHVRPFYSDPVLLHAQVKALTLMAERLPADDPRRQLPIPDLNRNRNGSTLLPAGGGDLYNEYHRVTKQLGPKATNRNEGATS